MGWCIYCSLSLPMPSSPAPNSPSENRFLSDRNFWLCDISVWLNSMHICGQCFTVAYKDNPDDEEQYRRGCFEADSSQLSCKIDNLENRIMLSVECCQGHLCNQNMRPHIPQEGEWWDRHWPGHSQTSSHTLHRLPQIFNHGQQYWIWRTTLVQCKKCIKPFWIGLEALTRSGPNDSCTLACFWTGSIQSKHDTVSQSQIGPRLLVHHMILAICGRVWKWETGTGLVAFCHSWAWWSL